MSVQPATPPASSDFAKDAREKREDVVAKSDSVAARREVANAQALTSMNDKLGAAAAPDSAAIDSAAPRLLSRNTIHAAGDTVVTTVYRVHGVNVSLIDHSLAREETLRIQVRGAVSEMSAKSRSAAAAVNSISWSDSIGHTRTLRGPLTPEQLTELKNSLFAPTSTP